MAGNKKRKRKSGGAFLQHQKDLKRLRKNQFKDKDEFVRVCTRVETRRLISRHGMIAASIMLTDPEEFTESFINAQFCLDRLQFTNSMEDFSTVSSSLMIGALLHVKLDGIADLDPDNLLMIKEAAFMLVQITRLRNKRHAVPDANIDAIRDALAYAQNLVDFAQANERNILIDVLRENDKTYVASIDGLLEQRERFILGRNYDRVQEWVKQDGGLDNGAMYEDWKKERLL